MAATKKRANIANANTAIHEYEAVIKAVYALEDAFLSVFAAAKPGMTADEIDTIIASRVGAHGGYFPTDRFRNTPCVIEAGGLPPKLRRDRVALEEGKLWMMDNSIHVNGYWADLGRYGWFGTPPGKLVEEYQSVIARQDQIAAAIQPWMSMREIMRAIPDGRAFEVHRIGREASMRPFCGNLLPGVIKHMEESDRLGLVFEPGQCICVELWAGLSGGIEDMYLVKKEGLERISTLPRQIFSIPLTEVRE
jgi:Xaa-Pro aminopeptidase